MSSVAVTLPDGSRKVFPVGATPLEVAQGIGPRLAREAVAARVNDRLWDLCRPLPAGESRLDIVTSQDPAALEILRHTTAHILAQAVQRLYGREGAVRLWVGPPLLEGYYGFYYDMDLDQAISLDDLPKIEAEMEKIVREDLKPERFELSRPEGSAYMRGESQPYKVELIEGFEEETVSFYRQGEFVDLCRGPHLPSTGRVGALKLLNVTGAYLRGDPAQKMLQRVYGTAFFSKKELDAHLHRFEEAKKRDHRKLGKELDLFSFHPDIAPGSPFFHPRGATLYNLLVEYMRGLYRKYGYREVITPQILSEELWKRSGHYDHFRENMFFAEAEKRTFAVKPMNCPGHALMFSERKRSYRELPLRLADFGRLHRFEPSGVLAGLTRVRSFSQDDAHIFCAPGQIQEEVTGVIRMLREVYATFGFGHLEVTLSTRPPNAMGSDEVWAAAQSALREALAGSGLTYRTAEGEGAFYGPKIDFLVQDLLERKWQLGTVQLDFSMPERFGLAYIDTDSRQKTPVMIHRALLGSIERFLGVYIEHVGGHFPVWLAPVQVMVLPITDAQRPYAEGLVRRGGEEGLRVEGDWRNEKIGFKIREASLQKIPYMAVVGEREVEKGLLSIRHRSEGDLGTMDWAAFVGKIRSEVETKGTGSK
jgi:threonyl-tRNA synthetase